MREEEEKVEKECFKLISLTLVAFVDASLLIPGNDNDNDQDNTHVDGDRVYIMRCIRAKTKG